MADTQTESVPLQVVLEAERLEILSAWRKRQTAGVASCRGDARTSAGPSGAPNAAGEASQTNPVWQIRDKEWVDTIRNAHDTNLVGLAFSGGGIRSATFNLGVLQALADLKLLQRIDYLSTVSGGGYIGAWLAAWTKRLGSLARVQERLAINRVEQEDDKEPTPIRFLRMFTNYLTPKLGIFSGDTWAMVSIYLRNLLLNQIVVLALLATFLLLPRLAERLALAAEAGTKSGDGWIYAGFILLVFAFLIILNNMTYLDNRDDGGARQLTKQAWILALAAAPLFAVAVLAALWQAERSHLGISPGSLSYGEAAFAGALAYCAVWTLAGLAGLVYRRWTWLREKVSKAAQNAAAWQGQQRPQQPAATKSVYGTREFASAFGGAIGAGALAGWLFALLAKVPWTVKASLTFGAPLVLGIFLLAGVLHIGLMGNAFRDRRREWWGRLGGWLLLSGIAWLVIFSMALYFPDLIMDGTGAVKAAAAKYAKYLTPAWILTTVGSLLAGNSKTTGKPGKQNWKDVVARVGPYVFVTGLLCWVSYAIAQVQQLNLFDEYRSGAAIEPWGAIHTRYATVNALLSRLSLKTGGLLVNVSTHRLWWAIAVCLLVTVLMAWRVDINQFSMHLFYRNRLVRCYLGASNKTRSPNRFTGFDGNDDMPLKELRADAKVPYDGPYPILNMALNLVKGKDLAWQERKAESFVMTPRYCGFDVWLEEQDSPMMRQERPQTKLAIETQKAEQKKSVFGGLLRRLDRYGYRCTEDYAFPHPFSGPNLGLAMGISGAAASPNMGSFTQSTPVAFLMTVFNVRLGQWLGNPRHRGTWTRATPRLGLWDLVNELLGGTDDESGYVYLSDGGHFENLAIYELVKRRCGLIIACDAEADGGYGFEGLGNAIRKCRIDLGINIDLDVVDILPQETGGPSKLHCAVGRIHYETVDLAAPTGTIIYFKASLTGDEPTDVKNYKKTNEAFPHESTIDQWFSEAQFESYRALGYHEVMTSIRGPSQGDTQPPTKAMPMVWPSPNPDLPGAPPANASAVSREKQPNSKSSALAKNLQDTFKSFGFGASEIVAKSDQRPS
jgi:hypothetical protein